MNRGIRIVVGSAVLVLAGGAHAASVTRTSAFAYDAAGQVTKEVIEPGDSNLCLATSHTYDNYGNKTGSTVRNCNGSALTLGTEAAAPTGDAVFTSRSGSVTYDSIGQFPVSNTNALNQTSTTALEPKYGNLNSAADPNGLGPTSQYDDLGRKILEIRPDGTRTKIEYLYCSGVNGGTTSCLTNAKYVIVATPLKADGTTPNGPWSKAYHDLAGRVIRTETQGFDCAGCTASTIRQDTEYDSLGRVYRTSRPYDSGTGTPQWTTFTYDTLGRMLTQTMPDASVTTLGYNGLVSTVTNDLGQTETRTVNSQGQLVSVKDAANKTLTYLYDPLGNLVQTTDPAGNVNTLSYDLRGRKTQMIDRDMGTWTYAYNAVGDLIRQTDAKSQVTTMAYDKLGRMTQRTEADLVSNWYYDYNKAGSLCVKSIGKLCESESDNGYNRKITYDLLGRPIQTVNTVDTTYTTGTTYDANSRVDTQTYPTGLVVKYGYTNLGYLNTVKNGAGTVTYWTANEMDAEGHLLRQTYGNLVETRQTYKANTGRIETILAGTGNVVQNLSYQFDDIGNLLSRSDANQTLNETFTYDNRNRLDTATVNATAVSPAAVTDYNYNDIGNISAKVGWGTYVYNASGASSVRPHAVTRINYTAGGRRDYTYDANGNLLTEVERDAANVIVPAKGRTATYTSFNMPLTLANPASTLSFVYGPEHQRIKQITPTATTIYLHPNNAGGLSYEKDIPISGNPVHKHYINAGGQVIALIKQTGTPAVTTVQYMHRDALGSVTAVTDASGAVVERFAYEPFGKRRFPAGPADPNGTIAGVNTDRGFTNHEHLDELGLIHMNGRVYDPTIGRFISADPVVENVTGLQAYNRYSYVQNNPLISTDPTGYWSFKRFVRAQVRVMFIPTPENIFKAIQSQPFQKQVDRFVMKNEWAYAIGQSVASFYGGAAGAAAWSSYYTYNATGSMNASFKSGAISLATSVAFQGAGALGDYTGSNLVRVGAHAAIGCASASASGGKCGQGAASAFLAKATTIATNGDFMATVVAGGVAREMTGGQFTDGALSATIGYLFNHCTTNRCFEAMRSQSISQAWQAGFSKYLGLYMRDDANQERWSGQLSQVSTAAGAATGACLAFTPCSAGTAGTAPAVLTTVAVGAGALSRAIDPTPTGYENAMFIKDLAVTVTPWGATRYFGMAPESARALGATLELHNAAVNQAMPAPASP